MISHLDIKTMGKSLVLTSDFAIDIEDANPLFNDNEMYSYPVSIPLDGNRFLVKNMENMASEMKPVEIEHTPMTIYVDGMPYRSGIVVVDDGQELKDELSFSIQSRRQSLDEKVSDLSCRDVPLKDKVQIGEMIGDVKVDFLYNYKIYTRFEEWNFHPRFTPKVEPGQYAEHVEQHVPLQALGFSYPFVAKEDAAHVAIAGEKGPQKETDFINVSDCYPQKPYCNTRVCYKHYKKNDDGTSGDVVSYEGEYGPFYVLDADRPQSAPCFYVLYFFDCLFHYLQINCDLSRLMAVDDLKRLFFFNTQCKYDLERKHNAPQPDFDNIDAINKWISSRAIEEGHCGKLAFEVTPERKVNSITLNGVTYDVGKRTYSELFNPLSPYLTLSGCAITVKEWEYHIVANVMKMFANSDNFPDDNVSSIFDAMWNAFGVKFLMNYETNTMRAILIRDVYRDASAPIDFPCEVISVNKIAEKITGVKMTYAEESDEKEQRENVKRGVKDYDTNFDYIDYARVNSDLTYEQIIKKRSNSDMTTYVDRSTGNAYRLKVDSEAESVSTLNARLFEVGGYKGVTIGDCSSINEDFVEHFEIGWAPMLFTDVNLSKEMAVGTNANKPCTDEEGKGYTVNAVNRSSREQVLAAFLDEDMWHENIEIHIDNAVSGDHADGALREILTTDECYDPSSTEDGNSPLQHAEWGTAVGIMRGGGTDMTVQKYDYNYDGFGSYKWRMVSGKYAVSTDSIDNWGNDYDYNGTEEGIGAESRFSLKIRSYKNHPQTGEPMCVNDARVKNRGLFDSFMSEHAHFLLNRKKYKIVCRCSVAALADIPNHWERRYNIGGIVGWINKINSRVSVRDGLDLVEVEMYSL